MPPTARQQSHLVIAAGLTLIVLLLTSAAGQQAWSRQTKLTARFEQCMEQAPFQQSLKSAQPENQLQPEDLQRHFDQFNEMFETKDRKIVGLEIGGISHPSIDIVEEIIMSARNDSGLEQDVVANYKIENLGATAIQNYDQNFQDASRQIFSKYEGRKWWTNNRLEKLYGIAALPFFLRKKKSPSLIIVSKYKPIIEKDSYFLYISKYLIKDKNIILETKSSKYYLYRSNNMIQNKDLKLFGILPKHYEG